MNSKFRYRCKECGFTSDKWIALCPKCNSWSSLIEELQKINDSGVTGKTSYVSFDSLTTDESIKLCRYSSGFSELDRVLGGGLVTDSFVLLGGDPGIGKSTLVLQMINGILNVNSEVEIFYVSGEESLPQIRDRARRVGVGESQGRFFIGIESSLEKIFEAVDDLHPDVLVLDSLQTMKSDDLQSSAGSVSQMREVTSRLMTLAKTNTMAVWLIGHVVKDGELAGPKTVEHMVDTVLYFEGDCNQSLRALRPVKNRFGSTREIGYFEMNDKGLSEKQKD